jgi:hypothetical protein
VVATLVASDRGEAAWCLGALLLALSLPVHLHWEWADFPVWYHVLYLSYLVPVAGLAGRLVRARAIPQTKA